MSINRSRLSYRNSVDSSQIFFTKYDHDMESTPYC